jgi:DNA-binding NarL/FixJ family response regulator
LKTSRQRTHAKKKTAREAEKELLQLVQTGVEQFILKHATVEEFLKMTRALAEKEKVYSHQLTKSVFSRIVRDAVRKRDPKQTK